MSREKLAIRNRLGWDRRLKRAGFSGIQSLQFFFREKLAHGFLSSSLSPGSRSVVVSLKQIRKPTFDKS
jgi:hypothetical protein